MLASFRGCVCVYCDQSCNSFLAVPALWLVLIRCCVWCDVRCVMGWPGLTGVPYDRMLFFDDCNWSDNCRDVETRCLEASGLGSCGPV